MPKAFRRRRRSKELLALLREAGSDAALAKMLGVSRQAIGLWDSIPKDRLEQAGKIVAAQAADVV